jgi:hypothetical protein
VGWNEKMKLDDLKHLPKFDESLPEDLLRGPFERARLTVADLAPIEIYAIGLHSDALLYGQNLEKSLVKDPRSVAVELISKYEQPLNTLAEKAQFHNADEQSCHFFLGCSNPREHVQTDIGENMYYKPLSFEEDGIGPVKILVFDDSYNIDDAYMFQLSAEQIREAVNQKKPIELTADMATHTGKDAMQKLDYRSTMEDFYQQLL